MSIAPGTRLGPYEIVSHIGAGGMGEVWKACDTRLDRTVASLRNRMYRPRPAGRHTTV